MKRPESLAEKLTREPWHTALSCAAKAVWDAQEATALAESVAPLGGLVAKVGKAQAIRELVRARTWLLDATELLRSQKERELHGYLIAECDALATRLGFKVEGRAAA